MLHANNLANDRNIGKYWEQQFCLLAARHGRTLTPLQIGRDESAQYYWMNGSKWHKGILPDITIWTSPGEHHEIKHKNPNKYGNFGLEKYRLDALLAFADVTRQSIMYTIHNHDLSGGRTAKENDIAHWFTADIQMLNAFGYQTYNGPSYVNGQKKTVPICYWNHSYFQPLTEWWQL